MDWDVFISHASEDKESFVRPLAQQLERYAVSVWYDEFELKIGDSLSKSIDNGLMKSNYGLIIVSKSFIAKGWTDYEMRSLLTREINNQKVILPIWHEIDREDIIKYSPYLADKFSLSSSMDLNELALKIIEVVRPDIINKYLLRSSLESIKHKGKSEKVPISKLFDGPIVHDKIPPYVLLISKYLCSVFQDTLNFEFVSTVENFARDWDYDEELKIWTIISCSFLDFLRVAGIEKDINKKKEAAGLLLSLSLGTPGNKLLEKLEFITVSEYNKLIDIFARQYLHVNDILGVKNNN